MTFTVGSLFSGAGLGDLGLEWAGFEHRFFCENDNYASKVLSKRWPDVPNLGDITKVDFTKAPRVDLLSGGFPCQDISVAGKGAGIGGEKSGLWKEFARAISDIRPRFALIENSPMLINRGLNVVLSDLAEIGYDAEWRCISSRDFGAVHKRERLWIVAYSNSTGLLRWPASGYSQKMWQGSEEQLKRLLKHSSQLAVSSGNPRRKHDGCPSRVDRLRCLGNGQFPHCTYFVGRVIMDALERT